MEKNMTLKNRINKRISAKAVLILALLVPSQQYAFAMEPQKALVALSDNSSSFNMNDKDITKSRLELAKSSSAIAEVVGTKSKYIDEVKTASKDKTITKVKLAAKADINKQKETITKAVLTVLVARKSTPTRQTQPAQKTRSPLSTSVNKPVS